MKSFIAVCALLVASTASAQCPNCRPSPPVVFVPRVIYSPHYAVPYAPTYRGAVLQQQRAGLAFRWLPGDAWRGRGAIYVPVR